MKPPTPAQRRCGIRRRLRSEHGIAVNVIRIGVLAVATGRLDEAATLAAGTDGVASQWGSNVPEMYRDLHRRLLDAVGAGPHENRLVDDVATYALEVAEAISDEHRASHPADAADPADR